MWEWIFADQNANSKECPSHAIRDEKFVFLKNLNNNRTELYDLSKDERQLYNIVEKYPEKVTKLSAQIDEWTKGLPVIKTRA